MIKKFTQIKSVGKFRAFQAKDDISFKEFTLIYADNGSGKTTMTSIIRSLINNDYSLLKDRKSINAQDDIFIQLLVDEEPSQQKTITFSKESWSSSMKNIEIFDCFFIHDNIYSGFDFSNDHQKKLYNFVLGEEGVQLTELLVENKNIRHKIDNNINKVEEKIKFFIPNEYHGKFNIKEFLKIKKNDVKNVKDEIKATEIEYNQALNNEQILGQENFKETKKIDLKIEFDILKEALSTNPESIQNQLIENAFNDHITDLCDHGIEDATIWTSTGFNYIAKKFEGEDKLICPFCTSNIGKNNPLIIKSYFQKFNEIFNQYMQRLKDHKEQLSKASIDLIIIAERWKVYRDKLYSLERYWKDYIPEIFLDVYELDIQYLSKCLQKISDSFFDKIEDPSRVIHCDEINSLFSVIEKYNFILSTLNASISKFNVLIVAFKGKLKGHIEVKDKLDKLKIKDLRFSREIDICCRWHKRISENKRVLEGLYSELSKKQTEESNQFMDRYGKSVNHYLDDVFMTPFRIEKISPTLPEENNEIGLKRRKS